MTKAFVSFFIALCVLLVPSGAFATGVSIDSPAAGSTINSLPVTFSGTAIAFGTVTVKEDGKTIATTKAGANGSWSIQTSNVTFGSHTYTAHANRSNQLAIMRTSMDNTVDVVDMDSQEIVHTFAIPDDFYVGDTIVVGDRFFLSAYMNDGVDSACYLYEYSTLTFELIERDFIADNCVLGTLAIDEAGQTAAIMFYDDVDYFPHLMLFDIEDEEIISEIEIDTSDFGAVFAMEMNKAGTFVYVTHQNAVVSYSTSGAMLSIDDLWEYMDTGGGNILLSPDQNELFVATNGLGFVRAVNTNNIEEWTMLPIDADDSTIVVNAMAVNPDGTKLLVVGYDSESNKMWEFDLATYTLTNTTLLTRTPESVSITEDGLNYIVGDNFSSGIIYFGQLGTNAYSKEIAKLGASYYNNRSTFLTPAVSAESSATVTGINVAVRSALGTIPETGNNAGYLSATAGVLMALGMLFVVLVRRSKRFSI